MNHNPGEAGHDVSVSAAEHLERVLAGIRPLEPVTLPLGEALGRTLAADLVARDDVPGFDNSAMDGYALRAADASGATESAPATLTIVADLPAGAEDDPAIGPGEAVRIMTGAPVPSAADSVVPVEHTDGGEREVLVHRAARLEANIRRLGSDIRAGQRVLPAGALVTPGALAAAAATGVTEVLVHPAPRVGVLSTGSELRPAGERLRRGQVHDSNLVLVAAAVAESGGVPVLLGQVRDDADALIAVLREHAGAVDAIVTTGGVSEGVYDVVKSALAPLGVWFGSVRMRPGRPQGFGRFSESNAPVGPPIFALPGNPVSVFVSFEAFVRPALLRMQGRATVHRESFRAVAAEGWASREGRTHFLPVVAERAADGGWLVRRSREGSGAPGPLAGMAGANAIAVVAEPVARVVEGDELEVWLLG